MLCVPVTGRISTTNAYYAYTHVSTQVTMAGYQLGSLDIRGVRGGDFVFDLLVTKLTGHAILCMCDYSYWCSLPAALYIQ